MGKASKRSANGKSETASRPGIAEKNDSNGRGPRSTRRRTSEEAELVAALERWDSDTESIPDSPAGEAAAVENKTAKDVLCKINKEFTRLRKEQTPKEAWQYYQAAMSENMHLLSDLISVKDQMQMILEIESKMKGESGGMEGNALEQVSKFLSDPPQKVM